MSLSLSLVSTLFNSGFSGSDASSSLLNILNGSRAGAPAIDQNPINTLRLAEANTTKDIALEAKDSTVARDMAAFRAAVNSAPDLKTLLANPQARTVLLTANNLGDSVNYPALAQKALASDPADKKSLVYQLTDTRWLTMAKTYNFFSKGLSVLKSPAVLKDVANGYAQVLWQNKLDVTTPGISAALEFRSRASKITSALQILGDSNLRKVVTTALGLPLQIALQPLDTQERAITSRLDITQFNNPAFVEKFTQRFLLNSVSNAQAALPSAPAGVLSLFA